MLNRPHNHQSSGIILVPGYCCFRTFLDHMKKCRYRFRNYLFLVTLEHVVASKCCQQQHHAEEQREIPVRSGTTIKDITAHIHTTTLLVSSNVETVLPWYRYLVIPVQFKRWNNTNRCSVPGTRKEHNILHMVHAIATPNSCQTAQLPVIQSLPM